MYVYIGVSYIFVYIYMYTYVCVCLDVAWPGMQIQVSIQQATFGMISNPGVDTQLTGDVCPFNVLPHQGRKWQIALQMFHEMDSWQVSCMTGCRVQGAPEDYEKPV